MMYRFLCAAWQIWVLMFGVLVLVGAEAWVFIIVWGSGLILIEDLWARHMQLGVYSRRR